MAEKEYIERAETCKDCLHSVMCDLCADGEICGHFKSSADVVDVRHGEWEFRNDGRYGQTRCYCSACGKHSGIGGIRENQMKPYCPNCGAKMDGGKRNERT